MKEISQLSTIEAILSFFIGATLVLGPAFLIAYIWSDGGQWWDYAMTFDVVLLYILGIKYLYKS